MKSLSVSSEGPFLPRLLWLSMVLALVIVVLFSLFPGHERLRALAEQPGTDGVSIAYMQLLLRTHPGDTALRWALAQKLVALGKWSSARSTLTPLLGQPGEKGQQARLAALEIDFSMANALSTDKRDSWFAKIIAQVEVLSNEVLRPPALARLAQISLAVNRPDLAARLRRKLAELDPAKRQTWLDLAAQSYLASALLQNDIERGRQWLWLAHRHPSEDIMDQALRLAAVRRDDAVWIDLASRRVQLRPLAQQQVELVREIGARRKVPRKLLGFLEAYVKRYPAEREIWEVLANTQEQLGDLNGARATWQLMSPYLISAQDSARRQARLLIHDGNNSAVLANRDTEGIP